LVIKKHVVHLFCNELIFHTPDSSGKPLSEARSLERIAGKRSVEKLREGKRGEEGGRKGKINNEVSITW
jgi:hypothetical protein